MAHIPANVVNAMSEDEKALAETAPVRRVVQISTMVHEDKDWAFVALCDDGSLWLYHGSWSRIESIPQTTDLWRFKDSGARGQLYRRDVA